MGSDPNDVKLQAAILAVYSAVKLCRDIDMPISIVLSVVNDHEAELRAAEKSVTKEVRGE